MSRAEIRQAGRFTWEAIIYGDGKTVSVLAMTRRGVLRRANRWRARFDRAQASRETIR